MLRSGSTDRKDISKILLKVWGLNASRRKSFITRYYCKFVIYFSGFVSGDVSFLPLSNPRSHQLFNNGH